MLQIGQLAKVTEPFDQSFPDVYEIEDVITHDDGQVVYILKEIGGFAPQYVEPAQ